MTRCFEHREIDDEVTQGDAGTRGPAVRLENPIRQILQGKIGTGRDIDKGTK